MAEATQRDGKDGAALLLKCACTHYGCRRAAFVIKDGAVRFRVRHDGAVHVVAISLDVLRRVLAEGEGAG